MSTEKKGNIEEFNRLSPWKGELFNHENVMVKCFESGQIGWADHELYSQKDCKEMEAYKVW